MSKKKRNPTKRTEERSGRESSDGPPDLPEGAEHAEYAGYTRGGGSKKPGRGEAEATREAELQPGGDDEEAPE